MPYNNSFLFLHRFVYFKIHIFKSLFLFHDGICSLTSILILNILFKDGLKGKEVGDNFTIVETDFWNREFWKIIRLILNNLGLHTLHF